MERKILSKRAKKGMRKRAKMLKWGNPTPPLGYSLSKAGWLIINAEEAEVVREVFDNYLYFKSMSKTAQALNLMGFKTKYGGKWSARAVRDTIMNKIYIGQFRYAGVSKHLEALRIVSDETFKRANEIRQDNYRKMGWRFQSRKK